MGTIWSPDRKFWSPTNLIYNLHKNIILNVTLYARKVITKLLERNNTGKTSKATVGFGFFVSGLVMVFFSVI